MAAPKERIMYLEEKSEGGGRGPARIGLVRLSRTGQTVHYGDRSYQRLTGGGVSGNYFDTETGEEYWISGPKKDGCDRHWAGGGPVSIDENIADEYWLTIRGVEPPADPHHT